MASSKNTTENKNVVENLDSHLTSAGRKVANNKKIIYVCTGVVAVVAAFVLSYLFIYRNPRLQNSWGAYNKVLLMQQKGEIANDSIAAIEYQKVSENFSSTPAGDVAALAAAVAYYNVKNYSAAIKLLEKLDLSESVLQSQALALLADCYVNTKQYDKALSTLDKAIKTADENPQLVPSYLVKKANIYDAQKKYDKAIECYEQIEKSFPYYRFPGGLDVEFYLEREKAYAGK